MIEKEVDEVIWEDLVGSSIIVHMIFDDLVKVWYVRGSRNKITRQLDNQGRIERSYMHKGIVEFLECYI